MSGPNRLDTVERAVEVLLLEAAASPGWARRHRLIAPIIRKLTRATARRLSRQQTLFYDRGLPLIADTFTEADRKPPARALKAIEELDQFTDAAWDRLIEAALRKAVEVGIKAAASDVAAKIVFDRRSPIVADYLRTRSGGLIAADIDVTTKSEIARILATGFEDKWTFEAIKKAIRNAGAFSRTRAETIAITEVGNAFTHGTVEFQKQRGERLEKSWLAEGDACPICAGNAGAGWIPFTELFPSGANAPLQHPRCRCALLTRRARS